MWWRVLLSYHILYIRIAIVMVEAFIVYMSSYMADSLFDLIVWLLSGCCGQFNFCI